MNKKKSIKNLCKEYEKNRQEDIRGVVETGLQEIDNSFPIREGDFTLLTGRPCIGKSSLVLQISNNLLMKDKSVLFFITSMTGEDIINRMISLISGIEIDEVKRKRNDDPAVSKAMEILSKMKLDVVEAPTIGEVCEVLENTPTEGYDIICFDWFPGILPDVYRQIDVLDNLADDPNGEEHLQLDIEGALRRVKELVAGCTTIISITHPRIVWIYPDHRPRLEDLSGYGFDIQELFDKVWMLHRDDYFDEEAIPGISELTILDYWRRRNLINLEFDNKHLTFSELSEERRHKLNMEHDRSYREKYNSIFGDMEDVEIPTMHWEYNEKMVW